MNPRPGIQAPVTGAAGLARGAPGGMPFARRLACLRPVTRQSSVDNRRMATLHATFASPVGPLLLAADADGLRLIEFANPRHPVAPEADWREGDNAVLRETRRQLEEYFAGTRRGFDLPLAPRGTTFQRTVWNALSALPYGITISYGELARRIGAPGAVRAVGAANGRNPLPIVVPCHRVIGADGSLTGFGGGLPIKQFLLRLEGALPDPAVATGDLFG
jgi:methylated-DNA-[protein]-cysteine S-methyltransferase